MAHIVLPLEGDSDTSNWPHPFPGEGEAAYVARIRELGDANQISSGNGYSFLNVAREYYRLANLPAAAPVAPPPAPVVPVAPPPTVGGQIGYAAWLQKYRPDLYRADAVYPQVLVPDDPNFAHPATRSGPRTKAPLAPLAPPLIPTPNGAKTLEEIKRELTAAGWPFTTDDEALRLYFQITAQAKDVAPPADWMIVYGQTGPNAPGNQPAWTSAPATGGSQAARTGATVGGALGNVGEALGKSVSVGGVGLPMWALLVGAYVYLNRRNKRGLL